MKIDIKVKTVLKYMTMLIGCFVICVLSLVLDDSYRVRADGEIWETEDNDTPETANEVPLMTLINGRYGDFDNKRGYDKDYFSFIIPDNGCVWLSLREDYKKDDNSHFETGISIRQKNTKNNTDEYISEFGDWNRDTLENRTSKKIGLRAGTYYFTLPFYQRSDCARNYAFVINYEVSSEWESERNNTILEATSINVGTKYYASLTSSDSTDCYSFSLTDDGYISLSFEHDYVDSLHSFDTGFYSALDKNLGRETWRLNSLKGGEGTRIGLTAGTYYLKVGRYNSNSYGAGDWKDVTSYSFTINYSSSDCFEKEPNNSIIEANEISTNSKYSGSIVDSLDSDKKLQNDTDWYKFKVEKNGKIKLTGSIDSSNENTSYGNYQFYDSDNNSIGYERSIKYPKAEADTELTDNLIDVSKGEYYLKLYRGHSGDEYSFTVEFSEDGSFNDIKDNTKKESTDSEKEKGTDFSVKKIKYTTVDKDEVTVVGFESATETVTIPATITVKGTKYDVVSIAEGAFEGNKKIKRVTIKADLDFIGENAFAGCTSLTRLDLTGSISEIGRKAFYKCKKLKQIYISTDSIEKIGSKAFSKIVTKAQVKVPKGMKKSYTSLLKKGGLSSKSKIQE